MSTMAHKAWNVNFELLKECMLNDAFVGSSGRHLLGTYIGSVEVVSKMGCDYVNGPWAETEYYLAVKLINGPIVGVNPDNTIFRVGRLSKIHWGMYPEGFEFRTTLTRKEMKMKTRKFRIIKK